MMKKGIIVLCLIVSVVALIMVLTGVVKSDDSDVAPESEKRKVVTFRKEKLLEHRYVLGRARERLERDLGSVEGEIGARDLGITSKNESLERMELQLERNDIAPQEKEAIREELIQGWEEYEGLKTRRIKFIKERPTEIKQEYAEYEAKILKEIEDIIKDYVDKNEIDEVLEISGKQKLERDRKLEDITVYVYNEYVRRRKERYAAVRAKEEEKREKLSVVVSGTVKDAGLVYVGEGISLMSVIRSAGGLTDESCNHVRVIRNGKAKVYDLKRKAQREFIVKVNDKVEALTSTQLHEFRNTAQTVKQVTICGYVNNACSIKWEAGMTLKDVLNVAGGVSTFGSPRIRLTRNEVHYIYEHKKVEHQKLKILPSDVLEIPARTYFGEKYQSEPQDVEGE